MKRRLHPPRLACAALAAGLLGVVPDRAAPTLTTITIDGNMADWAAVLANPDNVVLDGPGGGLLDADPAAPANLNVTRAAVTWDATYLYLHVSRVASSPEFNYVYLHLDLDNDGLVADNAPLLRVGWWGNNRRTDASLDAYRAASPATGDPITSAGGSHDGYKLPGTRFAGPLLESLSGGSAGGLEMETRISWAALGLAPGAALQFHISTTRRLDEYPAQIRDNLGRGTGFAAVVLAPDRSAAATAGATSVLAHTLTNTGNLVDRFDLTWTSAGAFIPVSVTLYQDADAGGTLTPGDIPLADTDGDGSVDSGALAPGASVALLAAIDVPSSAALGQVGAVVLRAASSVTLSVFDEATDTLTIAQPSLTLLKSADRVSAPPASRITYTIAYTNAGTADALAVQIQDPVPVSTRYLSGSATGSGMAVSFSHDGGVTFDASDAAPVTHVRFSLGGPLPAGGSGSVTFQVTVD